MSQERLIKKYANRRLYDASQSRHITLDDIRALIVKGEKIKVVEDKTGDDITRHILLQVIAEQEQFGRPILSHAGTRVNHPFLRQLDAGLPRAASSRRASRPSCASRTSLQAQLSKMVANTPLATMADLTRQNLEALTRCRRPSWARSPPKRDKNRRHADFEPEAQR